MMLALLFACAPHPHAGVELLQSAPARDEPVAALAAGVVRDGAFVDAHFPLSISVPPDWEAIVGHEGANPRVTLVDPETRARLEISVREGGELGPADRRGCTWTYTDLANYRALPNFRPTTAGSCTPDDPLHARVLGYFVVHRGDAYDFYSVIPPGALVAGKLATEHALGGLRLHNAGPIPEIGAL